RDVCDMVPGEPTHLVGLAHVLVEADQQPEARARLAEVAGRADVSSRIRAEAAIALATLDVQAGEPEAAASALHAVAVLPLDDEIGRNVSARLYALAHPGPAGPALRTYFFGRDPPGGAG